MKELIRIGNNAKRASQIKVDKDSKNKVLERFLLTIFLLTTGPLLKSLVSLLNKFELLSAIYFPIL